MTLPVFAFFSDYGQRSLQFSARHAGVRACRSTPSQQLPPPSPLCSPSIRRREKTSFSSENTVVLNGTQVGWMAQLLTLPCLGRNEQLPTPGMRLWALLETLSSGVCLPTCLSTAPPDLVRGGPSTHALFLVPSLNQLHFPPRSQSSSKPF